MPTNQAGKKHETEEATTSMKGLTLAVTALLLGGCGSIPETGAQPPGYHPACETAKGPLDDFGPGVERCREQNADKLDDLPRRR
jgi:hypothetical protein